MAGLHPPALVARYRESGAWGDTTIDELFRRQVAAQPDRIAVVDPPNKAELTGGKPQRWTWRQLDAAVDRLAAALVGRGIGKGDVVAAQLPNSVDLVQTVLATVRIGAVLTPFPVQYRERELVHMCQATQANVFITCEMVRDRKLAEVASSISAQVPSLRRVLVLRGDGPAGPSAPARAHLRNYLADLTVDPNDSVSICWTSGTEAPPKGVPRCHYDWLAIARVCHDAAELTSADVMLNPFPMVNMAGFGGLMLPWLMSGCVLVQHQPFEADVYLRQIQDERATYTIVAPALLARMMNEEQLRESFDLTSLRLIGSGAAPLAGDVVAAWETATKVEVINFFGSNEGTCLVSTPKQIPDAHDRSRYFPRNGVARGVIAEAMELRLVDTDTGEVITESGRRGELRLKGPTLFAGYQVGTSATFFDAEGFFRTGDLFEIAGENSDFLRYVDRVKDIIIRGGINIAPAEIENMLAAHPSVADVAVVGVPDEVMGERTCAVVVPTAGTTPTLDDLVEFLRRKKISSYKLPERLAIVESLPRTPAGKMLKWAVRAQIQPEPVRA
ncbi:class I adenylate-forming enzyme family protein [Fodinicola feengrottensis]